MVTKMEVCPRCHGTGAITTGPHHVYDLHAPRDIPTPYCYGCAKTHPRGWEGWGTPVAAGDEAPHHRPMSERIAPGGDIYEYLEGGGK